MATSFTTDIEGNTTGTIDIPEGLFTGVKEIVITGTEGTRAVAKYADGTGVDNTTRRGLNATVDSLLAPLAQTFALSEQTMIGGIELYLAVKGADSKIVVQIREVEAGIPTKVVLAESTVEYADLAVGWTRFEFPPITCLAEVEYAICVYSDNADHKLSYADIGAIDEASGEAVTKQSYRQGVFLTSSNGTAWTVGQTRDLAFKILKCTFTSTTRTIELGTMAGTDVTDVMVLAGYELPTSECSIEFQLELPDTTVITLDKDQAVPLDSAQTGDFILSAVLTGTTSQSPVLFGYTQLVLGTLNESCEYHSIDIEVAAEDFDYTVTFESDLNSGSDITVYAEDGAEDTYTELTLDSSKTKTLRDGWVRRVYKGEGLTAIDTGSILRTKIKLVLDATVTGRPYIRALTGVDTAA